MRVFRIQKLQKEATNRRFSSSHTKKELVQRLCDAASTVFVHGNGEWRFDACSCKEKPNSSTLKSKRFFANWPFCKCSPPKAAKLKVSSTQRNLRKGFFNYDDCGFFKWLERSDIRGIEDNGVEGELKMEVAVVKNGLTNLGNNVRCAIKFGVLLYLILLLVVLFK